MVPQKFSLQQRIYIVECFLRKGNYLKVQLHFAKKFLGVCIPQKTTILSLVNKFKETGSVMNRRAKKKSHVPTEEKHDEIGESSEHSPQKSLRQLSRETGVSRTTALRALKMFQFKPYRVIVTHQSRNNMSRLKFCKWVLQSVEDGIINPKCIIFTDETWFHLHDQVVTEYNKYWSSESSCVIDDISSNDEKVGVWCAITAHRIIGPIFFDNAINSETYRTQILNPFFEQLTDIERQSAYFQQDSTTAHIDEKTLNLVKEMFKDRVISRGLWPSKSPDLSTCNFYLWKKLKMRIYKEHLHTMSELKDSIVREIRRITEPELQWANASFLQRCEDCVVAEGHHFVQLQGEGTDQSDIRSDQH